MKILRKDLVKETLHQTAIRRSKDENKMTQLEKNIINCFGAFTN